MNQRKMSSLQEKVFFAALGLVSLGAGVVCAGCLMVPGRDFIACAILGAVVLAGMLVFALSLSGLFDDANVFVLLGVSVVLVLALGFVFRITALADEDGYHVTNTGAHTFVTGPDGYINVHTK